jgi:predicted PurR-regulated permease PerM
VIEEKSNAHSGTHLLVFAAALVIIVGSINQAEPVPASFLVAVFLSVIETQLVRWLARKHISSAVALLFSPRSSADLCLRKSGICCIISF